jgi:predicted AAA+ superfamily ATPase
MMRRLHAANDWAPLAHELAAYFAAEGVGLFGRYRAFRWMRDAGGGHLEGVAAPDPVRLADLVDYELERQPVLENTRQFVAGAPANNVLLYGDRGTGKSSTIKALANEYAAAGLRLIEVAKDHLGDYPRILALLRGRRERFILFVDDLSFDEHETQYKALKAVLEGGLEARPDNVVLYATSNRRRLVVERFSDRQSASPDDEVNPQEAAEEKLSLADRFGIHAPFLVPDQERYLAIVEGLAAQYGLDIPGGELRRRAVTWAQWHNGRSCRAARQFVDAVRGEAVLRASGGASRAPRPSADSKASSRSRRR